jgi:Ca-activated chloride channel homolog
MHNPPVLRRLMTLTMTMLVASVTLSAQQEPQGRFEDSISVGYVIAPIAITDSRGRAIRGVKASDVRLFVDGKEVATDMFEPVENAPISFTILVDASGSMGLAGKMIGARIAVANLLGMRRPGDEFALFTFHSDRIEERVPFTKDADEIMRSMRKIKPFGRTAFFDALAVMPEKTLVGSNGAKCIVLLTDGLDNASSLTREQFETVLQGVSVPVYPLTIRFPQDPSRPATDEHGLDLVVLNRIAEASGGRMTVETDVVSLKKAISNLDADLRSQYLLGFSPTGEGGIKYRKFSVRLRGWGWHARLRGGYIGTQPPYRASKKRR